METNFSWNANGSEKFCNKALAIWMYVVNSWFIMIVKIIREYNGGERMFSAYVDDKSLI